MTRRDDPHRRASRALALLAVTLLAGCGSLEPAERRGAAPSTPAGNVARGLVGRWGIECTVIFSAVGATGRVVGRGVDGTPIAGQFREAPGDWGAAGTLAFQWPVPLVDVGRGLALTSAGRLRLTGPIPRGQNSGYPVSQSFDLERCRDDGEPAPRGWAPIGALPLSPHAQGDFQWA